MANRKVASPEALIRIGTASHITRLSTQHLRTLADRGELRTLVLDGYRYYFRREVEQFAAERSAHAS